MLTRKTIFVAALSISAGALACENSGTPGSSRANSGETPTTANNPNSGTNAPQAANNPAAPSPNTVTNTNATVAADPLANVENKDKVRQYPDEIRFSPARPAKLITGFSTAVRGEPSGESISTVETKENVSEVARDPKGNYYLIVYPDPKDESKQLAGWVYRSALENVAWSESVPSTTKIANTMASKLDCAKGQAHVRTDRDFCAKTCKDDKGCDKDKGEICDGVAFEVNEKNGKTTNARYCISSTSPGANDVHSSEHGSSKPLDTMK
jgi:hypothetical protein